MKWHVFLLGAPAVGKLTIAKELSLLTDYPVFDNAKTVDISRLLHEYGTNKFRAFRDKLRLIFYSEALDSGSQGLISTFCYRGINNLSYLTAVANDFNSRGWKTLFVLLTASIDTLRNRVGNKNRKHKMTIHTIKQFDSWLVSSPGYLEVPIDNLFTVDTSLSPPKESAMEIVNFLGIGK